jgi:Tfp pilus assembly protein PilE
MRSLLALRHSAVIVLLLLAAVTTAAAQEVWQVTKLRTPKVTLYDCANGKEKKHVAQKDFQPPWPVTSGPTEAGLLVVKVEGSDYCVRAYAVETNKTIAAKSDCGALVAVNQPKSGATRGVGEDCKGKK